MVYNKINEDKINDFNSLILRLHSKKYRREINIYDMWTFVVCENLYLGKIFKKLCRLTFIPLLFFNFIIDISNVLSKNEALL